MCLGTRYGHFLRLGLARNLTYSPGEHYVALNYDEQTSLSNSNMGTHHVPLRQSAEEQG